MLVPLAVMSVVSLLTAPVFSSISKAASPAFPGSGSTSRNAHNLPPATVSPRVLKSNVLTLIQEDPLERYRSILSKSEILWFRTNRSLTPDGDNKASPRL